MDEKIIEKSLENFQGYRKFLGNVDYEISKGKLLRMLKEIPVSEENIRHCTERIFPVAAIYKTIKEKYDEPIKYTSELFYKKEVYPKLKFLKFVMKIPFLYKLMPTLGYKTMKKSYPPSEDGFQIEVLEKNKKVLRFDVKQCTYYNYCKKLDVPELCDIFCTSDDISAKAMGPKVVFKRKETIGRGGNICDFCYKIK